MSALAKALPGIQRCLLLAFSSTIPGEVVGAIEGAKRKLAKTGIDAHDLVELIRIDDPPADTPPRNRQAEQQGDEYRTAAEWAEVTLRLLIAGDGRLHDRDIDFMLTVRRRALRGMRPTPKQQKWLNDIRAKLGETA